MKFRPVFPSPIALFLGKLVRFAGVLFILCLPVVLYLMVCGEFFRPLNGLLGSTPTRYVVGYAYSNDNYVYLKWKAIVTSNRKKLWAVGTSRVLEFRSLMFDSSFYNAGFAVKTIKDYVPFLRSIDPLKYPETLIVGLDPWMFTPAWDKYAALPESHWSSSFSLFPSSVTIKQFIGDAVGGNLTERHPPHNGVVSLGLNAKLNDTGILSDGSMHYGGQVEKLMRNDKSADDFKFTHTLKRIKKGGVRFEWANEVSSEALAELRSLLKYCKTHNIFVVGFITPYPGQVYSAMQASEKYKYLDSLDEWLRPEFDSFGFEFHDFMSAAFVNSPDSEMIDGLHGSEVTYLRILIAMLDRDSRLNKYVGKERLKEDLLNRMNRLMVYPL